MHWPVFLRNVFRIDAFAVSGIGLYLKLAYLLCLALDFVQVYYNDVNGLHQALAYLMYVALDCILMNCIQNWLILCMLHWIVSMECI